MFFSSSAFYTLCCICWTVICIDIWTLLSATWFDAWLHVMLKLVKPCADWQTAHTLWIVTRFPCLPIIASFLLTIISFKCFRCVLCHLHFALLTCNKSCCHWRDSLSYCKQNATKNHQKPGFKNHKKLRHLIHVKNLQQYWFGERASVVSFRIAQNSAPSWWWWSIQYVSSILPSSIRHAWGVLWKFVQGFCELINHYPAANSLLSSLLRLDPPTKCEEEEQEEEELSWQSCNLCSRNLIVLSPFLCLVASFIELYSFNHATVFIHFFVQWAREEIEEV